MTEGGPSKHSESSIIGQLLQGYKSSCACAPSLASAGQNSGGQKPHTSGAVESDRAPSPARFYLFVKNIVTMKRRSNAQEAFQAPSMKVGDLSPSYISQGRRKPLLATTLWSRQVFLRFFSVNNSGLRKGLLCRMIRSCQESYRDQASKDTWSSRHHHEDDIWLESSSVQHSTQQKEAKAFREHYEGRRTQSDENNMNLSTMMSSNCDADKQSP